MRVRRILNVTHQRAARDAASVYFRPSIMSARTFTLYLLSLPEAGGGNVLTRVFVRLFVVLSAE